MKLDTELIKNVLIYRSGAIGDTIVAIPAIRLLKNHFKKADFILLTAKNVDGRMCADTVLEGFGLFKYIFTFNYSDKNRYRNLISFIKAISDINVDLIVCLSGDKNSTLKIWRDRLLFLFFSGIRRFVYIKSDKTTFYGCLRRSNRTYINEVLRLVEGLKKIGIKCNNISFDLPLTQIQMRKVTALLKDKFINNKSILIGMCPWTKQQAKRWPVERYAELGKKLIDNCNANIVIVGGNDEAIIGKEISKEWPENRWIVIAGKFDVLETAELLKRCAFYVGNDTGAMHVAAAVGTPCIAIFSAKDPPESWHPFGADHIVLRKNVPCRNCYLNECYSKKLVCLTQISLDEVFERCKLLMSKTQEEK